MVGVGGRVGGTYGGNHHPRIPGSRSKLASATEDSPLAAAGREVNCYSIATGAGREAVMSNELFGWISVLGGLVMGLVMGVKFQREEWLGGYGAFPRRMVRLAHVALVALGMLNIQYAQSA